LFSPGVLFKNTLKHIIIMNSIFDQAMVNQRGPSPEQQLKRLEERKKQLKIMSQVRKLELQEKQYKERINQLNAKQRQEKIMTAKKVSSSFVNVIKAGHKKLSRFDQARMRANLNCEKEKSVYD